jgi:hypothetical protein
VPVVDGVDRVALRSEGSLDRIRDRPFILDNQDPQSWALRIRTSLARVRRYRPPT